MEDLEYKKSTDMVIMRQTFSGKESPTGNVRPPTFQQYYTAPRQRKSTPSQYREVKVGRYHSKSSSPQFRQALPRNKITKRTYRKPSMLDLSTSETPLDARGFG